MDETKTLELGNPGPRRDRLVAAVLSGQKVATSALLLQYEDEGAALPEAGERRVLVDSSEAPVAVVEMTGVQVIRLRDADLRLALDEGEGFESVPEWREAHEAFWTDVVRRELRDPSRWRLDGDTEVVVERFRVEARCVTSADGTRIGYRQVGSGPGLVVLHGSMSSSKNHMQLAEALADHFTVYLPDRRGRGLSGPYDADAYTSHSEAEDLEAVLDHTGATNVFGVSVGGIIALQTARAISAIEKLAIYEPPLFPDRQEPTLVLRRFDEQMAQGRIGGALATAMQGAHLAPEFINRLPHRIVELMTNLMLRREDKKGSGDYSSFRELAPTLHYETQIIAEMSGSQHTLTDVSAAVLLLGGSRSSRFLKDALARLEPALPHARRVELPGLDHSGSWNSDLRGKPGPVAAELRRFFT
jgi:uncharacterized protein YhfF/pimeloyl-ACP methyl ester carboxylesterase